MRAVDVIRQVKGNAPTSTSLLYAFDPTVKNSSFSPHILNKDQLLIVARLLNGVVLAGFYSGRYHKDSMCEPAALMNLTCNNSYLLKASTAAKSYKAMSYDAYYLIFGNA